MLLDFDDRLLRSMGLGDIIDVMRASCALMRKLTISLPGRFHLVELTCVP